MMRRLGSFVMFLGGACLSMQAQKATEFPQHIVIASDSFIDMGPPFDYYAITTIDSAEKGVHVEQVLVAASSDACLRHPSLEWKSADMSVTLPQLLEGKNPCDIPEKDLKKELKRCKHCATFSGVNVSMEMSCEAKSRTIRMDILDRDLFDNRTATPGNTSWTMKLTGTLNEALKTGLWDKPIFNLETSVPISDGTRRAKIVQAIEAGEYDHFFPTNAVSPEALSKMANEAELPPPVLLAKLSGATPRLPLKAEMPNYPPIARAAHVQGDVVVTFDVSPEGKTENLSFAEGDRLLMLHNAIKEAVAKWMFPVTGERYQERATVSFNLGCATPAP